MNYVLVFKKLMITIIMLYVVFMSCFFFSNLFWQYFIFSYYHMKNLNLWLTCNAVKLGLCTSNLLRRFTSYSVCSCIAICWQLIKLSQIKFYVHFTEIFIQSVFFFLFFSGQCILILFIERK